MSADSENPKITRGNWMKYCTVAKSMGWDRPLSVEVNGGARRLRSAAGLYNSGRNILESRCADRCANDAFLTSFRATLSHGSHTRCSALFLHWSHHHKFLSLLLRKICHKKGLPSKKRTYPVTFDLSRTLFAPKICSLFLMKCGDKDDDFPAPFPFHSSSLDGLSMSLTAVVEIYSASVYFSIFMGFLALHHDEGWNQQKMTAFWLPQLSPYSSRHGRKNEKENRSKKQMPYTPHFSEIKWP